MEIAIVYAAALGVLAAIAAAAYRIGRAAGRARARREEPLRRL
jgi:hypothetical protein